MRITILFAMLVFVGCKYQSESQEKDLLMKENTLSEPPFLDSSTPPPPPPMDSDAEHEEDQPLRREELNAFSGEMADKIGPKLVRTIDLSMEVGDYKNSKKEIQKLLSAFKIQLYQENESRQTERIENQIYMGVKPELLDSLVGAMQAIALNIDYKNIEVRDVTREYVDLEVRAAAKRAVVAQYQDLLKTAKNVTDVLAIHEQLNEEIEAMESARMELAVLHNEFLMSKIHLTFYKNMEVSNAKPRGFLHEVKMALYTGWQGFINSILFILSLWHLWLFLTIVTTASVWGIKKLRKLKMKVAA